MDALRRASTLTFAIKAETGPHRAAWNLCRPRRDTAIGRLTRFFSCSNSRVLLGGIANDYFAIKMPSSVGENRYNEGEADEERQRANQ
jgi:hypothetical protein